MSRQADTDRDSLLGKHEWSAQGEHCEEAGNVEIHDRRGLSMLSSRDL